jgi:hypothetical protein
VAPDGSFQVGGLKPGRVSVGVYVSSQASGIRPSVSRIEHDGISLPLGFELQAGHPISGLRIVISYGTGTIRGTVRFDGGVPPADLRTYISCRREGAIGNGGAVLDSRGHFVISGLGPGSYEVMVQSYPMNRSSASRPTPPQRQTVSVSNDAESEVTFVIDLKPKEGGP